MKVLARRLGALGVACLGLLAVHALVVNVLVIRSLGAPIQPAFGLGSVPAFLRALGLGVVGAAALRAALLLASTRRGRSLRYLRLLLLRPRSLAGLLAAGAIFALTSYGYVWLKVFVPVLNETLLDQQLYALDNWLHLGVNPNRFLLALWARRRHRPLSVLFTVLTAATFVGSLVTGWHYAVDGYTGLLLAWAGARLSGPPRGLG